MVQIAVLIAVLIGFAQAFKLIGLPSKYVPIVNIVLGLVAGIFATDGDIVTKVVTGIIIGLSASGLYDQSKIVTK